MLKWFDSLPDLVAGVCVCVFPVGLPLALCSTWPQCLISCSGGCVMHVLGSVRLAASMQHPLAEHGSHALAVFCFQWTHNCREAASPVLGQV